MASKVAIIAVVGIALFAGVVGAVAITGDNGGEQTVNTTSSTAPTTVTNQTPEETPKEAATPTATPTEETNETSDDRSGQSNSTPEDVENATSEPYYQAMFEEIIRSNSTEVGALETPFEGNGVNTSIIQVRSVSRERYGDANRTRLRVEIYDTTDAGDGAWEVRTVMEVYAHVINQSVQNGNATSFDEIDLYSYPNRSSTEPTGLVKISEQMAGGYSVGQMTAGGYENSVFRNIVINPEEVNTEQPELKGILNRESSENITVNRVEWYGDQLQVDYTVPFDETETEKRDLAVWKIARALGYAMTQDDVPDVNWITVQESLRDPSGDRDTRIWYYMNATQVRGIATGETSIDETFQMFRDHHITEGGDLNK